jgi:hypothetical protein
MRPKVSKAEIEVFKELSRRGLTTGMVTNDYEHPIILMRDENGRIKKATIPDFWWIYKRKMVYLDGDAVHEIGDLWDDEVVQLLELKGCNVRRIRYHAPLSEQRKIETVDEIQAFIGDKEDLRLLK